MPLIDLNGLGHFKDRENAMIAEDFSASKAYAAGDYCYYNGTLYKFKTAHAAGAWTTSDVEAAKLAGDVSSLKESLTQDYQSVSVQFESVAGEWINTDGFPASENGYARTDYIDCNGWYSFRLSGATNSNNRFYAFYDASKNPITTRQNASYDADISVNGLAKYVIYASSTYNISQVTITAKVPTRLSKIETKVNDLVSDIVSFIPQNSIGQEKLSFAELQADNIFNYEDSNVVFPGYWYYATTIGSTVQLDQNSTTLSSYHAMKIPCPELDKITLNYVPASSSGKLFWIGAVDADMKLISYVQANTALPYTFTVPVGTKYILLSMQIAPSNANTYLPYLVVGKGSTANVYYPYSKPTYLLSDVKIESDNNGLLKLPDSYDLVVGDTFQLFYKGIIDTTRSDLYDVQVICDKGEALERFYEITPTTAETLTLTVKLFNAEHELIEVKDVSLIVNAKASSPVSQKNVLCVGDSLTVSGAWVKELKRRLTGNGGTPSGDNLSNINFIGTCSADGTNYEGYGGWTFYSYNTANVNSESKVITCTHDKDEEDQHSIYKDGTNNNWKLETIESGSIKIIAVTGDGSTFPSTGTLTWVSGGVHHSNIVYTASQNAPGNPFWNSSANKVDFENYANNLGVSSIDYVLVLLGWNDASSSSTNYKQNAQTFIDNVHADFPDAKIVLMGIQIPARDGLATNYGASGTYADYAKLVDYVFALDSWYVDIVNNNTNVSSFNLSGQFDTEYNMPTKIVQVNSRNSETINRQSNGIHPATSGQYQIADAAYRCMTGLL